MSRFDKDIRDKLAGYSSPVSSDMWSKISSNLPPQEQTDPKTWWLPIVGVTTILIGAFALFLLSDSNLPNTSDEKLNSQTHSPNLLGDEDMATTSNLNSIQNSQLGSFNSNASGSNNPINKQNSTQSITNSADANNSISELKSSGSIYQNQNNSNGAKESKTLVLNNTSTTPNTSILNASVEKINEDRVKEESASLYKQYNAIINKTREFLNLETDPGKLTMTEEKNLFVEFCGHYYW